MNTLPKVLCIVGPTASGKTSLGLALAKEFNGEILNADSRQIYRGFRIGTGMPEGEHANYEGREAWMAHDIPHFLMDAIDPARIFSVAEWREGALKIIEEIVSRGKLPILVGGTGLYLRSLIDNLSLPEVPPNDALRRELEALPLSEISARLIALDPAAEEAVDLQNPRRVIRALEVIEATGKPFTEQLVKGPPLVEALQIGISWTREELNARIDDNVEEMIGKGWLDEAVSLRAAGFSEDVPAMSAIGYRELLAVADGKVSKEEAVRKVEDAIHRYAKRQMTWFKADARIRWIKGLEEARELLRSWK